MRGSYTAKKKSEAEPERELTLRPQLRVEPACTYYLRTARSYVFVRDFLTTALGEGALASLHALREKGQRESTLADELAAMIDLHYGLYLTAAEDIGLKAEFAADEPIDVPRCRQVALDWLKQAADDPDLAADVRVAVPIYFNVPSGPTRLWTTVGVRLTPLECEFAYPPSARPISGDGAWQVLKPHQLHSAWHLIAVDEFAEVEVPGVHVVDREEWRALCDQYETKADIIAAANTHRSR